MKFTLLLMVSLNVLSTAALASPAFIIECRPPGSPEELLMRNDNEPVIQLIEIQDRKMIQVTPYEAMGNEKPVSSSGRIDPVTKNYIYNFTVRHTFDFGNGRLLSPTTNYTKIEVRGVLNYNSADPSHSLSSETIESTFCPRSFLNLSCEVKEARTTAVHNDIPADCTVRTL